MKAVAARLTWGLNIGSKATAADNSGAKIVRITGVKGGKGRRGRQQPAKPGDWVKVSVRKGLLEMKGKVFDAVLIRQRKPYQRISGERIAFQDNAVALLKDEKGNAVEAGKRVRDTMLGLVMGTAARLYSEPSTWMIEEIANKSGIRVNLGTASVGCIPKTPELNDFLEKYRGRK